METWFTDDFTPELDAKIATIEATLGERLDALEKIEKGLDDRFGWRAYERSISHQDLLAGWKRLVVDRDWLANAADQMADPAMANTMAAILLADKDNEDAQRLRAAVSLRNAPKTS